MTSNPFVGIWAYRSLLNDPDLATDFDKLEFGRGTLTIEQAGPAQLGGSIGGPGWSLTLRGSFGFGSPMQVRFQGKGDVDGVPWVYDYIAWLVPDWPASAKGQQVDALVGSVTRTIFHGSGPAGEVASFYAVRQAAE
ncbi:hypothetical protein [Allosphingosinicella deserti]|uniref:Uncharacterized protein n=1 Tax=Allosphingosinicella deserti TaxID=2116704 RepID=A0A2P7QYE2_9SPHN|nr:hypothetical protein [Sphingomonas deserti]PSJ42984.1 hypothetical protein C7I55_00795 [Sphingomonas deserti]